jgi:hypothetical protein
MLGLFWRGENDAVNGAEIACICVRSDWSIGPVN